MNIAIIGYGRMGQEIEKISLKRGHQIVIKIDENNLDEIYKMNSTKMWMLPLNLPILIPPIEIS